MNEIWNDFERFLAASDHWLWITLGIALAVIVVGLLAGWAVARKRDRHRAAGVRFERGRRYAHR